MSDAAADSPTYAEVALPVPLRRLFTYTVPPALDAQLLPGSRVVVPLGRRKVGGVIVRRTDARPDASVRLRSVAGLLEREPLFSAELLSFLVEAAAYYFQPVGEALQAAAPALPAGALRRLRADGSLAEGERLRGRRVGAKRTLRVRRVGGVEGVDGARDGRLGPHQRTLLTAIDAQGEATLEGLRALVPGARQVLRTLAARGLITLDEVEICADPFFATPVPPDTPRTPNPAQEVAIGRLLAALDAQTSPASPVSPESPESPESTPSDRPPRPFLLHGVTGSGKTEVYLRLIGEARARGHGALLLVPEIALTPQLVRRLRARFGDAIAVLHSGLSDRERDVAWRALRQGRVRIAIGARSAIFAPVEDLRVVIVDEEHDASFKQEEGFRYHARDMALLRAARAGAVCVLGSATPSLESFRLAELGRLELLTLPERATEQTLPSVQLVDLRRQYAGPSGHRLLTAPLHDAIGDCLAAGNQAILFLNRRGFAPSLRCAGCNELLECPSCSVALTEHRRAGVRRCHYCDFSAPFTAPCPRCGAPELARIGLGTEKLEKALAEVFHPARVARLDRDTARGRGVEAILDRLLNHEIDLLVGTQMVTKGHDIPGVTLVGVLNADQSLSFPDFRAAERTFQLLSQVAGRAGRGASPGEVIVQSYDPGHFAIRAVAAHDYEAFYRQELADRAVGWPPVMHLVAVRVDAAEQAKADEVAAALAACARAQPQTRGRRVEVLGPAPAPIERLRGRYRVRLLLRAAERRPLRDVTAAIAGLIDAGVGSARAAIDVDPVAML
ncbi:MAG: primosomal protein N' [Myxococcales bacterium]|nr:primosomal protein N' [Myxococcales bacterium]